MIIYFHFFLKTLYFLSYLLNPKTMTNQPMYNKYDKDQPVFQAYQTILHRDFSIKKCTSTVLINSST